MWPFVGIFIVRNQLVIERAMAGLDGVMLASGIASSRD
jgi:hypothetical protein